MKQCIIMNLFTGLIKIIFMKNGINFWVPFPHSPLIYNNFYQLLGTYSPNNSCHHLGMPPYWFRFCGTKWVEDEPVTLWTVEVWPRFKKVIKHYRNLAASKQPKNGWFETLTRHCNAGLMIANFQVL